MGHARIRLPYTACPIFCGFSVPLPVGTYCAHFVHPCAVCARSIEDVSALWHLWRRAAAGRPNAEVQLYVVVYWKKEEQEETAMANAIYEKLQGSVIRRRTGWG